jgi:hypothetical protein
MPTILSTAQGGQAAPLWYLLLAAMFWYARRPRLSTRVAMPNALR